MKRRFVCADGGEYILDTPEPRYLRKKRRKKTIAAVVLSVCLLVIGAAVYFQRNVTKVLIAISEATMRSFTTVAINDAIYYTLSDGVRYEDLVSIERSEAGAITAVSANALKINKIARDAASISQANLKNLSLNGIPVPLGALTGIEALAGFGAENTYPYHSRQQRHLRLFLGFRKRGDQSDEALRLSQRSGGHQHRHAVQNGKNRRHDGHSRVRLRAGGRQSPTSICKEIFLGSIWGLRRKIKPSVKFTEGFFCSVSIGQPEKVIGRNIKRTGNLF